MLFNSYEFLFAFLPIVFALYFTLNKYRQYKAAKISLIAASIYFYAFFNSSYALLIIGSTICNYLFGTQIYKIPLERPRARKLLLILGLVFNLGLLGYFKYYDFFIGNVNEIFASNMPLLYVVLPLGISFFTFQQISFIVDAYHDKPLRVTPLDYGLFVTFFPQLIAGPIVQPQEILPQFADKKNKYLNYENINRGLFLFSIGLAKKILIADTIAPLADAGFDNLAVLSFREAWTSSLAYTMQIYFDFSGYCDMAMGIALMFNIKLPLNFNSPYKATNFQDFWQRWHITLGRFFSTYLYIPLGGNRKGNARTLINLFIVFFMSGLWHGAGWTFILWGVCHGCAILIHRLWKEHGLRMPAIIGWAITFFFVNAFWVLFRAQSFEDAMKVYRGMFDLSGGLCSFTREYTLLIPSFPPFILHEIILILSIAMSCLLLNFANRIQRTKLNFWYYILQNMLLALSILLLSRVSQFIYFNF